MDKKKMQAITENNMQQVTGGNGNNFGRQTLNISSTTKEKTTCSCGGEAYLSDNGYYCCSRCNKAFRKPLSSL